jgi:hypothetical protein
MLKGTVSEIDLGWPLQNAIDYKFRRIEPLCGLILLEETKGV